MEKGFDPANRRVSKSVFSMAAGFMGIHGYFEEGRSGTLWRVDLEFHADLTPVRAI